MRAGSPTSPRTIAAGPAVQQRYASLALKPSWEPDTVATRVTEIDKTGRSLSGVVIYQRRGNLLNGTYAWGPGSAVLHTAERCAALMAEEMNAAPAADVTHA